MTAGGPSSLGTLLIQRLDSLLGLTQSQQLNLSAGARPDAVTPTEKSHPGQPLRNPGKKPLATAQQRATQARATGHSPLERPLTSTPNAQPPQSSIQTHFGRTAHFILQLFEQLPQAPGLRSPQPLLSRPLSSPAPPSAAHPTPPSSPVPLASHLQPLLQQELLHSGLFYESLLRQHVQGKLPAKEVLQQQPQNILVQTTDEAQSSTPAPTLHSLIRQQLELLATQQWEWRGELWPGVPMYWQFHAHNKEHDAPQSSPDTPQWSSRIHLSLPVDDPVQIHIHWSSQRLDIHIKARPERLHHLKASSAPLRHRLQLLNPNLTLHWIAQ